MNEEQWRPITEAPGYDVSDHGRVRSWRARNGWLTEPRIKVLYTRPDGYVICTFTLGDSSKRFSRTVHSLVARAFLGEPNGLQVRHLDGVPGNNHVSNLAWGTASENAYDKVRHGSNRYNFGSGESHPAARLTRTDVETIRSERQRGVLLRELAERYGITKSHVSRICLERAWAT